MGCERGVDGGLREMRGASGDVQMREMRARMGAEEAHGGREQAAEGVPGVQIAVLVQGARPIRGGREMMRVTAMNGDGVLAMAMFDTEEGARAWMCTLTGRDSPLDGSGTVSVRLEEMHRGTWVELERVHAVGSART